MSEGQELAPYADGGAHLRDELRRIWLGVEYHTRRRWEAGIFSDADAAQGGLGVEGLSGVFRDATARPGRGPIGAPRSALEGPGAAQVRQELQDHGERLEARVQASLAAGVSLPLIHIVRCFALNRWQRATLTLAIAQQLDPDLLHVLRGLACDPACRGLDARLLAMLAYETPEERLRLAHDLSPLSPLIRYRLLDVEGPYGGTDHSLLRRVSPSPRLLHLLLDGGDSVDPLLREAAVLAPPPDAALLPEDLIERAADALETPGTLLTVQGPRGAGKRLLLQEAARRRGLRLLLLDGRYLDAVPAAELTGTVAGLLREAKLLGAVPVVPEIDDVTARAQSDELPAFLRVLCAEHEGAVAFTVSGDQAPRAGKRPQVALRLEIPSLSVRAALWQQHQPGLSRQDADALAERFAVTGGLIRQAARSLAQRAAPTVAALDTAVREQLHDRLTLLGRRLEAPYGFDDLVVEDNVASTLWEIASCVRERRRVREEWGLRGAAGVSVLFSGEPGVGKTMSATVLGRELGLLVYEIDLSRVTSKWLGETEKNLGEVFDAAEPGHVILLFNEADSLFGRRTADVKSASDRYANMETNYLLQRLERFGGLSILTTNLAKAIDPAFRRRFAYDVQFTFPTVEMRQELWLRALPPRAQVGELDLGALARRYELSGGFIKVAVERASFAAAGLHEPLNTELVEATIQRMYQERGKLSAVGRLD